MKCARCKSAFYGTYTAYGGLVYCDDECLARATVESGWDVDTVAEQRERRKPGVSL